MPDLVIHGLPPSAYVRTALMICAAKGVDHRLEPCDFRSDAYRTAHHPFARMPALSHGDLRLYETLAIGVYVDGTFAGPALQPDDVEGRARMFQWISVLSDYGYGRIVGGCVTERFVKPMRGLAPDVAKIEAALPGIEDVLDALDARLVETPWLAGPRLTLADLFLAPVLHYFAATPEGARCLPSRVALRGWADRAAALPGYDEINALPQQRATA